MVSFVEEFRKPRVVFPEFVVFLEQMWTEVVIPSEIDLYKPFLVRVCLAVVIEELSRDFGGWMRGVLEVTYVNDVDDDLQY